MGGSLEHHLRRVGILKARVLVDLVNYAGIPLFLAYVLSMLLYPWIAGQGNWAHVQTVWDRWQSLNVGVIAFISSLLAFNISRFNADRQREREFIAAKAFLPEALSDLVGYFKGSSKALLSLWNNSDRTSLTVPAPDQPTNYKTTFSECIRHAGPEVGGYLANILVQMQIHDARMRSALSGDRRQITTDHAVLVYLNNVGELQSMVAKLFPFARGEAIFDDSNLDWEDFKTAYRNLDIPFERLSLKDELNLESFTRNRLAKPAQP